MPLYRMTVEGWDTTTRKRAQLPIEGRISVDGHAAIDPIVSGSEEDAKSLAAMLSSETGRTFGYQDEPEDDGTQDQQSGGGESPAGEADGKAA